MLTLTLLALCWLIVLAKMFLSRRDTTGEISERYRAFLSWGLRDRPRGDPEEP